MAGDSSAIDCPVGGRPTPGRFLPHLSCMSFRLCNQPSTRISIGQRSMGRVQMLIDQPAALLRLGR